MTMPVVEHEEPRMAEVVRIVTDFRAEFREAMNTVVRKDVYQANLDALKSELAAARGDLIRQDLELRRELTRLDSELQQDRQERRNLRTGLIVATFAAGLSMLGTIIQAVMK
jgi:hypothetical protein